MFLNRIVNCKREEISQRKSKVLCREYKEIVRDLPPPRNFKNAIKRAGSINLIAEIKKASPSQGNIRPDLDPVEIAKLYEQNGASSISILTEQFFFKGNLEDLKAVRKNCNLPLLQKDFTIDVFQLYEARACGADAILLIAAILDKNELEEFISVARELEISSIIEVHNIEEVEKVVDLSPDIIGINNRDLKTFKIDLQTTQDLVKHIPAGTIKISESGIRTTDDIKVLDNIGMDAMLVGETIMKSNDIGSKVRELLNY